MKILSHKNKKILLISLLVIALLIAGAVTWAAYTSSKNSTPVQGAPATPQNNDTRDTPPASAKPNDKPDTSNDVSPKPASDAINLVVVDASQYDDIFEIRVYAEATEAGTCTYTFTKDSKVVTKQNNANSGPSTASCDTLDVPTSELGVGTWAIKIQYESTSKKYTGTSTLTATIK